jgi:hypothetical protein
VQSAIITILGASAAVALLMYGCAGEPPKKPGGATPPPPPVSAANTKLAPGATAGESADPHAGMDMGAMKPQVGAGAAVPNPHSAESGGEEDASVTAAVKAAADAEAALKASPGDAALKKKTSVAVTAAGDAMMMKSTLPSKPKYRGALRFFRRGVELDSTNKQAAGGRDLIEGIYTSMGMPVPK